MAASPRTNAFETLESDLVRDFLTQSTGPGDPSLPVICRSVSKYFNLKTKELKGLSRRKTIVRARGVAMLLSRKYTKASLSEIGKLYSNRDHTTVLHACNKTEQLSQRDADIRKAIDDLSADLQITR
jgi:chromosomal replication initiator protein